MQNFDEKLKSLARLFPDFAPLYLVGGSVRDSLLGINSYDLDICSKLAVDDVKNSGYQPYDRHSVNVLRFVHEIRDAVLFQAGIKNTEIRIGGSRDHGDLSVTEAALGQRADGTRDKVALVIEP